MRYRLINFDNQPPAIVQDLPGKIEINVLGAGPVETTLTPAEHDDLSIAMANGADISQRAKKLKGRRNVGRNE